MHVASVAGLQRSLERGMYESDELAENALARVLEHVPAAFAVTRSPRHELLFANAAFRYLTGAGDAAIGRPIGNVIAATALLDQVVSSRGVVRDRPIARFDDDSDGRPSVRLSGWRCSVWPELDVHGVAEHLMIELRPENDAEMVAAAQREVAERMLLSALKERDAAATANASRRATEFLAAESRRIAESLDEHATMSAVSRIRLPYLGAWCIVDVLNRDGTVRRLRIVHPDPAKQVWIDDLNGRWSPSPDDPFGLPAVAHGAASVVTDDIAGALSIGAHDAGVLRVLVELGVGSLLTVPLRIGQDFVGAITFVNVEPHRPYSTEDVALATELATRAALAIDRARLHGEAIALQTAAEAANEAKNAFLTMMSHELRTPLNAIGGYVDLLDMGLRGPVTDAQHTDLERIRSNQKQLLSLVTDILNLSKVASGTLSYAMADVDAAKAVEASVDTIAPLIAKNGLICETIACGDAIVVRADPDRVSQILLNLLSNAVKFTPAGGRLTVGCAIEDHAAVLRVSDTGIGVTADKLSSIFDPFVQVRDGLVGRDRGVGLGLSISRGLARAMGGDLTAESQFGVGSTFTLRLPRAGAGVGPS